MRTSLAFLIALGISPILHGQGIVNFTNGGNPSPEQKVYIDDWLNPSALAPGGQRFLVALYFSPNSDSESSLTQTGSAVGFIGTSDERTGIFFGGGRTVATVSPGASGFFQVKGWEAAYGATYEEAVANPRARVGKSPVFMADTTNPDSTEPVYGLIANSHPDRPFRGFVIAVPEPSTTILALAGIVAAVPFLVCKHLKR